MPHSLQACDILAVVTVCSSLGTKRDQSTGWIWPLPALDRLIGAMTPTAEVSTALPDLRSVRLDELAALTPAALDEVLQRVLPGTPVGPAPGAAFGSSI